MSQLRSKKILITGADGFIGSHLTEKLVRIGYDVRAFVYYNSFQSWGWLDKCGEDVKGKFEVISGDIRDPIMVRKAMSGCDAVAHLAALVAIPYSYDSPESYIQTNIIGTLNVLDAAKDLELSKVLHTSTSEVYGTARYVPMDEGHALHGQSPYSASKIGADQLALAYFASFDLPVTIIRPFNTFGPRQSPRAIIPSIISQIASGKREIELGSTLPTRDFSFVDDTVLGFLKALEFEEGNGEVFNLGSGFEISMGDLANLIARIMKSDVTFETSPERLRPTNSEVQRLCSDNRKAKEVLGWIPTHVGLEGLTEGLEKYINWFQNWADVTGYKTESFQK